MQPTTTKNHRKLKGILLILSPAIIFLSVAVISILLRLADIHSPIVNVFLLLAGMVGMVMIFLGPIIGIKMLDKRSRP